MTLVLQDSVIWQGKEYPAGEVIPDLPDATEARLIERGLLGDGEPVKVEAPQVEEVATPSPDDLSGLNKAQLVALAAERGVDHDSKVTKSELLKLLSA